MPVPRVRSLRELNEQLVSHCEKDLERTLRGKPASKRVLLTEEQLRFRPLPEETFDARRIVQTQADSLSLVRFDRNSYSVPTEFAYRDITAIGTVDEVRLLFGDAVVACHERDWGREQFHYGPVHYLALLESGHRPKGGRGGFDHAKPFEDWELPACFGILRRRLEGDL